MKQKNLFLILVCLGLLMATGARAQVSPAVDLVYEFGDMEALLGSVIVDKTVTPNVDLWHDHGGSNGIWRSVPGQLGPSFASVDNDGNGIWDDAHMSLLQYILNATGCLTNLNQTTLAAMRTSYDAARANILTWNVTLHHVFVDGDGFTVSDQYVDITTGTTACISTLAGNQCFDVGNLFGAGGLLDGADPRLNTYLIDIGAAYMVLGDPLGLAYFQGLLSQVMIKFIPVMINNMLAKSVGEGVATVVDEPVDLGNKFYTIPCSGVPNIGPITYSTSGITVKISQASSYLCADMQTLVDRFNATTWSYPTQLAASGNLNGTGNTNVLSWMSSGNNALLFRAREWVGYYLPTAFNTQPSGNIAPDPSVQVLYGGSWTFTGNVMILDAEPYTYQWYVGDSPSSMTPISGATTNSYSLTNISWVGTKYYRLDVTTACGDVTSSTTKGLLVTPPTISMFTQPLGGHIAYASNNTLSCSATIDMGTLSYQWYQNGSPISGATSNSYTITNATFANSGSYKCRATSVMFSNVYLDTNTVDIVVDAPPIVISLQPTGAALDYGASWDLECNASQTGSTLSYQWYQNGAPISGATAKKYSITNADWPNVGSYRCKITSDLFSGVYSYTNSVSITVGATSNSLFYVDQNSPVSDGDGLTWATAFKTIQLGIDAASAAGGGAVWVAKGTYNEERTEKWGSANDTDPANVTGSLVLKSGVSIYGGFEGYTGRQEVVLTQRAVRQCPTIIDGSQSRRIDSTTMGPAYHVVVCGGGPTELLNVVIDGFSITGGRALGIAGIATDPDLYHTWRAGGLFILGSSPTVDNCTFYDNQAAISGGAVAAEKDVAQSYLSAPQFRNCVFWNNTALRLPDDNPNPDAIEKRRGGGAVYLNDCGKSGEYIKFIYCTFDANTTDTPSYTDWGANTAAIYSWADPGIGTLSCEVQVDSSVFWANTPLVRRYPLPTDPLDLDVVVQEASYGYSTHSTKTITYSETQVNDPLFAGTAGPDFYLSSTSPCVNTGNSGAADPARDICGTKRPQGGRLDKGAYEYVASGPHAVANAATVSLDESGAGFLLPASIYSSTTTVPGSLWKYEIHPESSSTGLSRIDYTCSDLGAHNVVLDVYDYHGQVSSATAVVTVVESILPVAAVKDITVQLDASGAATITPAMLDNGSTDNCSIDWVASSVTPSTFSCSDIGAPVSVAVVLKDTAGNSSDTVHANVTVQDQVAPTAVCKDITVDLDETGAASITKADVDNGSADACGLAFTGIDVTNFTCANVGPNTVTLTVIDNQNLTSTCTSTVTVRDVTAPVITRTGPASVIVMKGTSYNELGAVAQDECSGMHPAVVAGDTVDINTAAVYVVQYTYSDASGNAGVPATRTVTVVNNNPPVITVLGNVDLTVECNSGAYSDAGATASDVEDGDLTGSIITTGLPIDTAVTGDYTVTYTVTDLDPEYPATSTATRTVHVVDTAPPVVTLTGDTMLYWLKNTPWFDPGATATDTCSGNVTSRITRADDLDLTIPGTYLLSYTAKDYVGNVSAPAVRTIMVLDSFLHFTLQPETVSKYVDDAAFDLTATFAGGYNATAYEWFRNGTSLGSNAVTDNTVAVNVDPAALGLGAFNYYVKVTDAVSTTQSATGKVTVVNHISLTGNLEDATGIVGNNFTWSGVEATGGLGTLTYQWYKDDGAKAWVAIHDGGNISGTGTASLVFTPVTDVDFGSYKVEVSDSLETVPSATATLSAGSGVPAVGLLGLAALAAMTALGGSVSIRRRK